MRLILIYKTLDWSDPSKINQG